MEDVKMSSGEEIMSAFSATRMRKLVVAAWSVSGVALMTIVAVQYLVSGVFGEQGMVSFASVSCLLTTGEPVYTDLDAANRYSLQHGPLIYIIIAAFMNIFGASVVSAKLPGLIFWGLTLIALNSWVIKKIQFDKAMFILGVQYWILAHWHYKYFSRPDAVLLCMAAWAMLIVATRISHPLKIVALAVFCGLAVNLKAHSILYFIPAVALCVKNGRLTAQLAAVGMIVTAITAAVPFFHEGISLQNYCLWVATSFSHEYTMKNFIPKVLSLAVFWAIPCCVAVIGKVDLKRFFYRNRFFISSLLGTMLIVSVIASKSGSGTNHFIPFIPYLGYLLMAVFRSGKSFALRTVNEKNRWAYVLLLFLAAGITIGGIGKELALLRQITAPQYSEIVKEYQKIERDYSGKSLAIAEGGRAKKELYRDSVPLPVFRGNPFLIDSVALGDMKSSGLPLPQKTAQAFADGKIKVWLVPAGERPFATFAYSEELQLLLYQNYSFSERRTYFDIWCYRL